ncbi:MAG TPA: molybdopterin cofactor-binding domain-containing protein, partial [bacterium]|nr:molybdopterin cofactor-binding domain-containing protein [bacterium]
GCQGIEIEIDRKTGEIHVLKMLTVIDAGTVVNPQMARGQVVGSMVQALGHAVSEGIIYSPSGNMRNRHFTDYKVPSPEDVWETEFITEFIETPEEGGPYGARSMGEHAIVSIAPALANAVKNGTGMDFFDLPMTPDRIATGIKDKGKR